MERQDWNMIGADCIVLSCCCQCLLLQLLVFVLLKLPAKLLKKMKLYMKRKFRKGGKMVRRKVARCAEEVVRCKKQRGSMRVRARTESFLVDGFGGCMEEVEEVLEELSTKGEFGFGSFWRGDDDDDGVIVVHLNQEIGHTRQVFRPF
ncbi:uncharacterized protein LOC112528712 [Cynara cardunculus var. scolymus]|uniref:uncharacterized protein LOC112528712 n=1 Tax=Cynara cardunculus var. scolymus TaxID=59895 RepID=UPI000D62E6F7|nr:uncharacterized protein LOC112528712 [Cynara cardunculus var. scolymus]